MRHPFRSCLLVLTGVALVPGAALSAPAPGPKRASVSVRATAAQLFELATQLQRRGNSRQAIAVLIALEGDPNPDIRREARYRQALVMEAGGRNREAAAEWKATEEKVKDALLLGFARLPIGGGHRELIKIGLKG